MENKTILAFATTFVLLLAGCGVFLMDGSDTSEGATTHDITVAQGQTWSYSVSVNVGTPSYSITGSATSWISLDSSTGTVSGTVPSVGSSDTTLNITATTTQPTQTYTQTINFTIVEGIGFTLGDNVNAVYNVLNHSLSVTGTGDMYDYLSSTPTPLLNYLDDITSIDIGEEITSVGSYVFSNDDYEYALYNLESISGCEGLTSIGDGGFNQAGSLVLTGGERVALQFPFKTMSSLVSIGERAFGNVVFSNAIILGNTVTTLGDGAFRDAVYPALVIGNGLTNVDSYTHGSVTGFEPFTTVSNDYSFPVKFMENDDTVITDVAKLRGSVFAMTEDMLFAYNALYGTAVNSEYNTSETYLVVNRSMPNSAEDNITFTSTSTPSHNLSLAGTWALDILNGLGNSSWTLSTAVGTGAMSSTSDTATFTSGTAPSTTGNISSTAIRTATYTHSGHATVTLMWDYGMLFTAVTVAQLIITSVPESTA